MKKTHLNGSWNVIITASISIAKACLKDQQKVLQAKLVARSFYKYCPGFYTFIVIFYKQNIILKHAGGDIWKSGFPCFLSLC